MLPSLSARSRPKPPVTRLFGPFLLLALVTAALPAWAVSLPQQYQQMRSQANLLAATALLHFDTDPRPGGSPLKDEIQRLNEIAQQLQEQAAQLGLHSPALMALQARIAALQRLSREQSVDYAALLIELLDYHEQLDDQLARLAQGYVATPLAQAMAEQSQRIRTLRLQSLARNARVLARHTLSPTDSGLQQLDQEIEQGFEWLAVALPEAERPLLQHQQRNYRFVRKQLLVPDTLRNSAAAQRYINGLVGWLDVQAANLDTL